MITVIFLIIYHLNYLKWFNSYNIYNCNYAILIGTISSNENTNKSLVVSIFLSVLLFFIYFGIQYSNYNNFEKEYKKRIEGQEETRRQQELEANALL